MRVNKKIGLCILSSMAISTKLNAQVGKDSVLLEEVQVVGVNQRHAECKSKLTPSLSWT